MRVRKKCRWHILKHDEKYRHVHSRPQTPWIGGCEYVDTKAVTQEKLLTVVPADLNKLRVRPINGITDSAPISPRQMMQLRRARSFVAGHNLGLTVDHTAWTLSPRLKKRRRNSLIHGVDVKAVTRRMSRWRMWSPSLSPANIRQLHTHKAWNLMLSMSGEHRGVWTGAINCRRTRSVAELEDWDSRSYSHNILQKKFSSRTPCFRRLHYIVHCMRLRSRSWWGIYWPRDHALNYIT